MVSVVCFNDACECECGFDDRPVVPIRVATVGAMLGLAEVLR